MTKTERAALLAAYYGSRERYDRLALEIERLFDPNIDPSVPSSAIYTIKHRHKDEQRLIEKLEEEARTHDVTPHNYAQFITDLVGIRVVCLLLSDVDRVETFIRSLADEKRLEILEGPEHKKTFLLQVDPRSELPSDVDLQYTGYSSVHYLVGLGEALTPIETLADLRAELQVRTLLEEAWGEIDHKYRYEHARSGTEFPDGVKRGFYSFAAYLQAAALQAEYLCVEAGKVFSASAATPRPDSSGTEARLEVPLKVLEQQIEKAVGFAPSPRTLSYIARRVRESKVDPERVSETLSPSVMSRFTLTYQEIAGREPFADEEERDVDAINAINFALFRKRQNATVAEAGLRDILARRFKVTYQ